MNDSDEVTEQAAVPQFGLIDLVDAFTAFRHEYRSQTKESRTANELLQSVARHLEQLTGRLDAIAIQPVQSPSSDISSADRRLALLLIDFDIQWTRAVEAASRGEEHLQKQAQLASQAFDEAVAGLSPLRRWLAGPLIRRFQQLRPSKAAHSSALTEGLTMLLARLRQLLSDHDVERIETLGKPFDGELMRSISTVTDTSVPPGYVAQQLSPAYRRQGQVIKYADVRVASAT